jgi:hypothetical protein
MVLVEQSKKDLIETVYSVIKAKSGMIRSLDLVHTFGNKHDVRFAISRLTVMGRVRRRRGFGRSGIEYFYHDTHSESFPKFRRMELRAFSQSQ